jgi:REP element-mobilizing transposase RayT
MSQFNPRIHHRRSIRLKGYDYAKEGMYFITICCFENKHLFGSIENGVMVLNAAGRVAESCWEEIPAHFRDVVLHAFVIMPNHVHGILEILGAKNEKDADGAGAKDDANEINDADREGAKDENKNAGNEIGTGAKKFSPVQENIPKKFSPHFNSPSRTIGSVVRGFKIGVTKWMRQNTGAVNVWHRNYYDIIIRNEKSYDNISNYIVNNPINWRDDRFLK